MTTLSHPHSRHLIPNGWPTELKVRKGKDHLYNLTIYHDFVWHQVFEHGRSVFRGGKSLCRIIRKDCPAGKMPILLLTIDDTVSQSPISTDQHYIVVIHVRSYLNKCSADIATTYLAGSVANVTNLAAVAQLAATPAGLTQLFSVVDPAIFKSWLDRDPTALVTIADLLTSSAEGFSQLLKALMPGDISKILDWIASKNGSESAKSIIERLRAESLPPLYTLMGIARMRQAIDKWEKNQNESDEEFWQKEFAASSFVLSQLFCQPVVIMFEKAYLGNKGFGNRDGRVADFLLDNSLTHNCVIVEIKTPMTKLLAGKYRNDVWNVSSELTGSIQQTTSYRHTLIEEIRFKSDAKGAIAADPLSVVVIGKTSELDTEDKRESFEHFRNGLRNITIVTYDELYSKLSTLTGLLEGTIEFATVEEPVAAPVVPPPVSDAWIEDAIDILNASDPDEFIVADADETDVFIF